MDFLEKETGLPYPWHAYSQLTCTGDFMYGGNGKIPLATVFGDFSFIDKRAFLDRPYYSTNCHENDPPVVR